MSEHRIPKKLIKPGRRKDGGSTYQAIDILVNRGHRVEDILNTYTLEQIENFVHAAQKNIHHERHSQSIIYRTALKANKNDFRRFLDSLAIRDKKEKKEAQHKAMDGKRMGFFRGLLSGRK